MSALFHSNGFDVCWDLLLNLLETQIDYSDKLYCDNNYKDNLLRYHHKMKWKFPIYHMICFDGPPHKRIYIMGVEKQNISNTDTIQTRCISYGIGSSKKEGEQNAAKMALIIYGILKEDQYVNSDIYYPPWNKINDGNNNILNNHDTTDINDIICAINTMNIQNNDNQDNVSIYSDKSV
jgi:hypothetical protein